MELRSLILDTFQALGIILVFVTLLFSMKYPYIMKTLASETPYGEKEKMRYRRKLTKSLATDCLPVLVLDLISLYVLLPLAVGLLASGMASFWDVNMLPMAYLAITIWLIVLTVWVAILTCKIACKRKSV
jgi:hypothetical protein